MDGPAIKKEQFDDTDDESTGLRENDVLCVRGQTDLDYSGNIAFRKLLNMNKSIYESTDSSDDIGKLASSVVELIEKRSGRFLARKQDHGIITSFEEEEWTVLDNERATQVVVDSMKAELGMPSISNTTDTDSATETSSQNAIDPALLVKLTAEQSKEMKYPSGCPVWYHMDTTETELHVSPGVVKGVSMDLTSRQLVYEVAPSQPEEERTPTTFVTEEELAFASKCPVSIENPDTGEITIGEVVNLTYSEGKKSYIVAYTIGGNQMCIKQSSEEDIKFSSTRTEGNGRGNLLTQQNNTIADARISESESSSSTNNELSRKRRRVCDGDQQLPGGTNGVMILQEKENASGRTVEDPDKAWDPTDPFPVQCVAPGSQLPQRPRGADRRRLGSSSGHGCLVLLEPSFEPRAPENRDLCAPFMVTGQTCSNPAHRPKIVDGVCRLHPSHLPIKNWSQERINAQIAYVRSNAGKVAFNEQNPSVDIENLAGQRGFRLRWQPPSFMRITEHKGEVQLKRHLVDAGQVSKIRPPVDTPSQTEANGDKVSMFSDPIHKPHFSHLPSLQTGCFLYFPMKEKIPLPNQADYPVDSFGHQYPELCAPHHRQGLSCQRKNCRRNHQKHSEWDEPLATFVKDFVSNTPGLDWNPAVVSPTWLGLPLNGGGDGGAGPPMGPRGAGLKDSDVCPLHGGHCWGSCRCNPCSSNFRVENARTMAKKNWPTWYRDFLINRNIQFNRNDNSGNINQNGTNNNE